jgi:hypothetical protein
MQTEFPWRDPEGLHHELEARTGRRLRLVLTDNSSRIISVKRGLLRGMIDLRLHRMFLCADTNVIAALAEWVKKPNGERPGKVLDAFISSNGHQIRPRPPRQIAVSTRGKWFDLEELFNEVNREEFGGQVDAVITWGRMPSRAVRRSIRFGSYSPELRLIRVHPFLDQAFVPRFFVRYIVFHEMLHAKMGIGESQTGRRLIHPRAFREREQAYRDYEAAVAWQNDRSNMARLLRRRAAARETLLQLAGKGR